MAYATNYLGGEIDENLEKGRNLTQIISGWIRLTSSSDSLYDLSKLKNTGNYLIDYWSDGPTLDNDIKDITPINILVLTKGGTTYQYAIVSNIIYSREYNSSTSTWGEWVSGIGSLSSSITDTEPTNPVSGSTIWIDTSGSDSAIIKIYIDGEWVALGSSEVMYDSTYLSSSGTEEISDVFEYAENAISGSEFSTDLNEHILDESMHVTGEEKATLDSKATQASLEAAGTELSETIQTEVDSVIDDNQDVIDEFNTAYTKLTEFGLEDHVDDTEIHMTLEERETLSNKAEATHVHYRDGTVNVYVDNVDTSENILNSGIISYLAKERAYSVASTTELYALTENPYHSGDMFYIEDSSGNLTWYLLANDKYLGTDNPEKAFILLDIVKDKKARWEQVTNTPTTLAGYGITDTASRTDVVPLNDTTHRIRENTQTALWDKLVETQTAYQTCVKLISLLSQVTL